MKPIVVLYIAVGVFGLFFGQVTGDLLSLGIRSEIVSIISKAIGGLVLFIGAYALASGTTLPPLPADETHAP
jgi:hypothetical protein